MLTISEADNTSNRLHNRIYFRKSDSGTNGIIVTRQSLSTHKLFEIRLDSILETGNGRLKFGITTKRPEEYNIPRKKSQKIGQTLLWSGSYLLINGQKWLHLEKDLDTIVIGDTIGIERKGNNAFVINFNGKNIEKFVLDDNVSCVYGIVDLSGDADVITIVGTLRKGESYNTKRQLQSKESSYVRNPVIAMHHMQHTIRKLKHGTYPDNDDELDTLITEVLQPIYSTKDNNMRKVIGEQLVATGGIREIAKLLEYLITLGDESDMAWQGTNAVFQTCWTYASNNMLVCKEFGQSSVLEKMLSFLECYGSSSHDDETYSMIMSALGTLYQCGQSLFNCVEFVKLKLFDRLAPFLKSEVKGIAVLATVMLSSVTINVGQDDLIVSRQVVRWLLNVLDSTLDDDSMCYALDGVKWTTLEITKCLERLAVNNDAIKLTMVQCGCIPLLVKALKRGRTSEQESACNTLFALSGLGDVRLTIQVTSEVIDGLNILSESQHTYVRYAAERALIVLETSTPTAELLLDPEHDKCICNNCHVKSGADKYYVRGKPGIYHEAPIGWYRFAVKVSQRAHHFDIFSNWHVAFHGTHLNSVRSILETGDLLLPGDVRFGGKKLLERPGHFNDLRKPDPKFDTKQIFLSPSIRYCANNAYSYPYKYVDKDTNKSYDVRVVFQVRIRPGSYNVGPETIGQKSEIDPIFHNQELEWFTKERGAVIPYGLLFRLDEIKC
ncbi:uncharacterized protein LOC144359579 [Saccoglossus kowalevskii]